MQFFFPKPLSPTTHNLSLYLKKRGWVATDHENEANFGESNLIFDEKAALCLEYKHLLAELLATTSAKKQLMPLTYSINDENWASILEQLIKEQKDCKKPQIWILKPSMLNNGQHIKIFQSTEAIAAHFLSPKRMGGEHVLQQYINNPHLLRDNRKYSIRQFLILTNYAGAYLYEEGYCNVAKYPFSANNFEDLRPHLTNEHLSHEEANVIQIPLSRFDFYKDIYTKIKTILELLIDTLKAAYPEAFITKNIKKLALFGVDFMVDAAGRVWLLEANHGPCFPVDINHPLQPYLYENFWEEVVLQFVLPMVNIENNTAHQNFIFERL